MLIGKNKVGNFKANTTLVALFEFCFRFLFFVVKKIAKTVL